MKDDNIFITIFTQRSSERNIRIQDSHISHSSEKEIALALSRLDLDLNKRGLLKKEDLESIVTEIQKNSQ